MYVHVIGVSCKMAAYMEAAGNEASCIEGAGGCNQSLSTRLELVLGQRLFTAI